MSRLIEFATEEGERILVEVREVERPDELVRAARGETAPEKAAKRFEEALKPVNSIVKKIVENLEGLSHAPNEAEVHFGLNLKADVGAFVAKTGSEGHFKIKLKWRREE